MLLTVSTLESIALSFASPPEGKTVLPHSHEILLGLASIFVLGIGAQWLSWKLKWPSILLLLVCGFLIGPVSGFLDPDALLGDLFQPIVSLSVAVILFEGSLGLKLTDLKKIGIPLRNLLTVGVLSTWILIAIAAHLVLQFDISDALVLGAILVVTGPTVITPLLLFIRPEGRTGPISRWEGIVIDPIGAVLTVLVFEATMIFRESNVKAATMAALEGIFLTLVCSIVIGVLMAFLLKSLLQRYWIPEHLESSVALMLVFVSFVLSNFIQAEAGLVTVTLMGVILANQKSVSMREILAFKETLSILLISSLFILLTAKLQISEITAFGWKGLLFVTLLIFVVRPVSVFLSSIKTDLKFEEKLFLSAMAPRGIVAAAVASVIAYDVRHPYPELVSATFIVIVSTVVFYSLCAAPIAKWLKISDPNPQGVLIAGAHDVARAIAQALRSVNILVRLVDTNYSNVRTAVMEGIPSIEADVTSELAFEKLDLGGIGHFLAMTPNDHVNSLAVLHMRLLFSHTDVYQLSRLNQQELSAESSHLHGQFLFSEDVNFITLKRQLTSGARIKVTTITEKFTLEDLKQHYDHYLKILFILDEDGSLQIATTSHELEPKPGQTVIALVDRTEWPTADDSGILIKS